MGTLTPPSLGLTGQEIFQKWRELSEAGGASWHMVVGWFPGEGTYSWRFGEIIREFAQRSAQRPYGYVAWYRKAIPGEIEAIHRAIDRGGFQIEARQITGCLGLYTNPEAGTTCKVYHQATGRRLDVLTPKEQGALEALAEISQRAQRELTGEEYHDKPFREICRKAEVVYEMLLQGLSAETKAAIRETVPLG